MGMGGPWGVHLKRKKGFWVGGPSLRSAEVSRAWNLLHILVKHQLPTTHNKDTPHFENRPPAAAGRLGWGRTRAECEPCLGRGGGEGNIPELGNSRDQLGIWGEGEGPFTGVRAWRIPHPSSSLFTPLRSGDLLAWLSPLWGQGSGEVMMGTEG